MGSVQRMRKMFMALGVALALGVPSAAQAQSVAQEGTWTVTPFLGGTTGVSGDAGDSMAIGVAGGYDLTSNIGVEGEVSYLFDIAGGNQSLDWSVVNVSGNFIYHFDVRRVTPYATFGLGFERSSLDFDIPDPLVDSPTEVAFNFGGGVKYPIANGLLLRGDLRRFVANDLAPDYWRVYGGLTFTFGR